MSEPMSNELEARKGVFGDPMTASFADMNSIDFCQYDGL